LLAAHRRHIPENSTLLNNSHIYLSTGGSQIKEDETSGYAASMGEMRNACTLENLNGRTQLIDHGVDAIIIIKWIFDKYGYRDIGC
jgi:hypothetical protein